MRVGVPCFGGDRGRSGIGRYITHLLRGLARADGGWEFEVPLHPRDADTYIPASGGLVPILVSEHASGPIANIAWHQAVLPGLARERRWDAILLPAGNRRLPVARPCPTVGVVHDISSLHVEAKYDPARTFYIKRVLPHLFRRLSLIITPSHSTARDVTGYARVPEDRVRVVPMGVDLDAFGPIDQASSRRRVEARFGIESPFFLYVSRIEHPGKNHVGLIRAFDIMKSRSKAPHRLVLAGSDWSRARRVHEAARDSAFATDIVFTGFVDAADLPTLYSAAESVVFPSLFEGFGLPVLEAMACGAPVACSDTSSLPEVAGDSALLFDPIDVEAMADSLHRLASDEALRSKLSAAGIGRSRTFTWDRTVDSTLAIVREACRP